MSGYRTRIRTELFERVRDMANVLEITMSAALTHIIQVEAASAIKDTEAYLLRAETEKYTTIRTGYGIGHQVRYNTTHTTERNLEQLGMALMQSRDAMLSDHNRAYAFARIRPALIQDLIAAHFSDQEDAVKTYPTERAGEGRGEKLMSLLPIKK